MKVIPGHSPAFFYPFSVIKILLPAFLVYNIFPFTVSAQDSLHLRSFRDRNIYYLPLVFTDAKKTKDQQLPNKGPYLFAQNIRFSPDTAAINERYKPGANPVMLWNLTYPPTEDQIKAKAEEEQVGRQIASDLLQTIFRRKKIPAVKPTF